MFYAGIGARATPKDIQHEMMRVSCYLEKQCWTLRSGGAEGADAAFASGCTNKEIFIPWKGFNGVENGVLVSSQAFEIAKQFHPAWDKLSQGAQKLMARNVHQILGEHLNCPSKIVICWTPDGTEERTSMSTGGTGQAIRMAVAYGIPVVNMRRDTWRKRLRDVFESV